MAGLCKIASALLQTGDVIQGCRECQRVLRNERLKNGYAGGKVLLRQIHFTHLTQQVAQIAIANTDL